MDIKLRPRWWSVNMIETRQFNGGNSHIFTIYFFVDLQISFFIFIIFIDQFVFLCGWDTFFCGLILSIDVQLVLGGFYLNHYTHSTLYILGTHKLSNATSIGTDIVYFVIIFLISRSWWCSYWMDMMNLLDMKTHYIYQLCVCHG